MLVNVRTIVDCKFFVVTFVDDHIKKSQISFKKLDTNKMIEVMHKELANILIQLKDKNTFFKEKTTI